MLPVAKPLRCLIKRSLRASCRMRYECFSGATYSVLKRSALGDGCMPVHTLCCFVPLAMLFSLLFQLTGFFFYRLWCLHAKLDAWASGCLLILD